MTREQFLRCVVACFLIAIVFACAVSCAPPASASRQVEAPQKFRQLYFQRVGGDVHGVVYTFEVWEGPSLCLLVVSMVGDPNVVAVPVESCAPYR